MTTAESLPEAGTRAVLVRLAEACAEIKTLEADFIQEKHLALFPEPVAAAGKLYFRSPDAVRLETTQPFRMVTIVNAEGVAKYEGEGEGWRKLKLGDTALLRAVYGQMAAWLRGDLRDDDKIFTIAGRQEGQKVVLVLTPRQARARQVIERLELMLAADNSRVESVRIIEPGENFTVLRFVNERRNVALGDKVFATDLPSPSPVVP